MSGRTPCPRAAIRRRGGPRVLPWPAGPHSRRPDGGSPPDGFSMHHGRPQVDGRRRGPLLRRFGVLLYPHRPPPWSLPHVTRGAMDPHRPSTMLRTKRSAPGGRAGPEQHPVLIRARQDVIHDPVAAPGHPEPFPVVAQWPDPHRDRAPLPGPPHPFSPPLPVVGRGVARTAKVRASDGPSPRSIPAFSAGRPTPRE